MEISKRITQSVESSLSSGPSIGNENYNTYELPELNPKPSTSTNITVTENMVKENKIPRISLQNCTNITINYNLK